MSADPTYAAELLTAWEAYALPLLWYGVPNGLLNIMIAFWLLGELRTRRRVGEPVAVGAWVAYSALIGFVWPAVTGPMAFHAAADARRRGHAPRVWIAIVSLFSFVGYIGYRVYDDAHSRGMRARCRCAAAGRR